MITLTYEQGKESIKKVMFYCFHTRGGGGGVWGQRQFFLGEFFSAQIFLVNLKEPLKQTFCSLPIQSFIFILSCPTSRTNFFLKRMQTNLLVQNKSNIPNMPNVRLVKVWTTQINIIILSYLYVLVFHAHSFSAKKERKKEIIKGNYMKTLSYVLL